MGKQIKIFDLKRFDDHIRCINNISDAILPYGLKYALMSSNAEGLFKSQGKKHLKIPNG